MTGKVNRRLMRDFWEGLGEGEKGEVIELGCDVGV